ncbi:MAG: PQQ-binding-like beta-propeller repeat protein [Acidobacteria bacterium]|nr:PQQ-binding-like beta-propeller repeat protein [Acidobacteriota bacterium]
MNYVLKFTRLVIAWLVISAGAAVLHAEENPVYFRCDGGVAEAASGAIPDRLDSPGVLQWRTPLDSGHSTPAVCKNRAFLTTFNAAREELATVALSVDSGKVLWKRTAPASGIEVYNRPTGNAAQATPACDGRRVYVFFGSYGLICYDFEGNPLWDHRMGPFQDEYGSASSPVLVDGKVIILQDHDVDSFLMALDAETGRVLWKTERPDAVRSYSTPAVWTRNGRRELLVAGGLELAGYDPSDGKKLWWTDGLARIVIPTPVPSGDTVYMASWSPGGDGMWQAGMEPWPEALGKWDRNGDGRLSRHEARNPDARTRFFSIDTDQSGDMNREEWERYAAVFRRAQNGTLAVQPTKDGGEQKNGAIVWKYPRGAPYVATPLLENGVLWLVKDGGIVTKIAASTGKALDEKRLPAIGNYYASPMSAGGKVFFASEQGTVTILDGGPQWRVISTHNFMERIYATPVVALDSLFIRTERALYCFSSSASSLNPAK